MALTPEEQEAINKFNSLSIPPKIEYEDNYSIKTNFLSLFKFINISFLSIGIIRDYIMYLRTQINAENIVNEVIANLLTNKMTFLIDINSELNSISLVTINNVLYNVTRTKMNEYEISRDITNWNVNKLIVQCKLVDGTVIYPKIKTFANVVTITTTDLPNENINVFIF